MGNSKSLRHRKLRVLVALVACTLSVASAATVHAPCKSKANPKASAACAPAAKGKAKSGTKAKAEAHKGRGRASSKAASRTLASAAMPAAAELPQTPATVDCDSTQTLLQGGAAQCAATAATHVSPLATQPPANPGTACFAALAASHSARRLAAKVPFLSDSAPSPEALANSGVPTRMEKEELGSVMAGYGMCLDIAASWRSQAYAPAVVNALNGFWRAAQSILSELASGKRSYGDAARAIAENDKTYKSQIEQL
jgi:hypothetical protein